MKSQPKSNVGGSHPHPAPSYVRSVASAALVCFLLGLWIYAGSAAASVPQAPAAQATSTASTSDGPSDLPLSNSTQVVPVANGTSTGPSAVQTGVAGPVQTGEPQVGPGDPSSGGSGRAPVQGANNNTLLMIVVVVIMAILAVAALMLVRTRRATSAAAATSATAVSRPSGPVRAYGATQTASKTSQHGRTTAAQAVGNEPAAMPTQIQCPNCASVNDLSENFCHECGQDLRSTRASLLQAAAAAAPAAPVVSPASTQEVEVEDDTPYLETLDRVDEQLEYVLARDIVLIGTEPGNDIVIDSSFNGWEGISPVHAELRREQDDYVVVDRESENGTFVNDLRTGENILADGDTLRLGNVRFIFHIP